MSSKDPAVSAQPARLTHDTPLRAVLKPSEAKAVRASFGHETLGDLVGHLPRRYAKRGELTAMRDLPEGEHATIVAEVRHAIEKTTVQRGSGRRMRRAEVTITDGVTEMICVFFNQPWQLQRLRPGVRGVFEGKVGRFGPRLQLAHPNYRLFPDDGPRPELSGASALGQSEAEARRWAETPVPIYPASAKVKTWEMQRLVGRALDALEGRTHIPHSEARASDGAADVPSGRAAPGADDPFELIFGGEAGVGEAGALANGPWADDPVPASVRRAEELLPLEAALELAHRPIVFADTLRARDTLRFHEAFVLQTELLRRKRAAEAAPITPRPRRAGGVLEAFDSRLPFDLTGDQLAVGREIEADLTRPHPMHRLVQGEVGSGKTLVALRAMLQVIDAGGQAVLVAPTEVLAGQHLRSIVGTLGPDLAARLRPTLITGQLGAAERQAAERAAATGAARILVGTHALFTQSLAIPELALVVIDEQHRFGVEQRDSLRERGAEPPHVLVLTATPIPRTVAMTAFGDLDVSIITELPRGRQGIETFVVPVADRPGWIARVWQRVAEELAKGHQAFVVCPAVSPTEPDAGVEPPAAEDAAAVAPAFDIASVEVIAPALRERAEFAGRRIEALHGRMKGVEKDAIMRRFAAGEIDVLVATTVIEVGVDVPNASTMVVLDADRFGISQLHQLRGRVGRGGVPGLCLLVTHAEALTPARERIEQVASTLDGFALAEFDLEQRREGNVLGATQSGGRTSLQLLRVTEHGEVIDRARARAGEVLDDDPELRRHPELRRAIEARLSDEERAFLERG